MLRRVDELMSIGEFSERSCLSPNRLRSYPAGGLLVPAAVDSASGYRCYSPAQLRVAKLIAALRQAGMPLADIAALLRDPSSHQLDAWARRVQIDAAHRQHALDLARQLLAIEATSFTPIDAERSGKDPMLKFRTVSRTDVGRVRDSNEDAVVSSERLAAVADGMGGHRGGEVASSARAELVRRGELTEHEALEHPHRGVLTRALGVGPAVEIDGAIHPAVEGDRLLLCTDGLFTAVPNDEIERLMTGTNHLQATADALVDLALCRGGSDNVTVVVADVSV